MFLRVRQTKFEMNELLSKSSLWDGRAGTRAKRSLLELSLVSEFYLAFTSASGACSVGGSSGSGGTNVSEFVDPTSRDSFVKWFLFTT